MISNDYTKNKCPLGAVATAAVLGIDLEAARSKVSGFRVKEARIDSTIPELPSKGINSLNSAILASLKKPKVRRDNDNNSYGLWFGLIQEKRIG